MEDDFNKKFVKLWMQAFRDNKGHVWLAEQLEVERAKVNNIASYLRNRGVNLPKLHRGKHKVDYSNLNEIIDNSKGRDDDAT